MATVTLPIPEHQLLDLLLGAALCREGYTAEQAAVIIRRCRDARQLSGNESVTPNGEIGEVSNRIQTGALAGE